MIASLHRKSIGQDTHEEAVMAKIHLRTLTEAHRPKALRIDMRYSHLPQSHRLAVVRRLCETEVGG